MDVTMTVLPSHCLGFFLFLFTILALPGIAAIIMSRNVEFFEHMELRIRVIAADRFDFMTAALYRFAIALGAFCIVALAANCSNAADLVSFEAESGTLGSGLAVSNSGSPV